MRHDPPELDSRVIRRAFDRASATYDPLAVLQTEVRNRLLDRLQLVKLEPQAILDLGAGTAHASRALKRKFPRAVVIALDFSHGMLRAARRQQRLLHRFRRICANATALPLKDASMDLVFSNLLLHWCWPPEAVFAEVRRVLKPRGLFTFTTFGPDTLKELRKAWAQVDDQPHVPAFIDMHHLGDALVSAPLAEPVLDVEYFTVTYADVRTLAKELQATGATNASRGKLAGLSGRRNFEAMARAYETLRIHGKLPVTCEVVYGQAWGALPKVRHSQGEVFVPLHQIKKR